MMGRPSAEDRRRTIIREAARLFERTGYFNTSMDDIAEAVGLRKPTLYHYVSSKEEILFLIHEEFIDHLTALHQSRLHSNMSCSQLLLEVAADIVERIAQYPGYTRAFVEHYRELGGEMRQRIKEKRDAYFNMIVEVIRRGMELGEFRRGNPTLMALTFFGMVNWSYQWYRPDGQLGPREIAQHFWDVFMNGIRQSGA